MKKLLKILLALVVIVALLIGGAALFIHLRGIPKYEVKKIEYTVNSTPEKVERGRLIALSLCANCHMNKETGVLTGIFMPEAPEFGKLYSQNITRDKTYGIGEWTDAELLYLLRTG